jgi:hypothetical protein
MTTPVTLQTLTSGSDAATWLAAIGTVAAVVVALGGLLFQNRSFRQERKDRLETEREASWLRKSEQARKVGAYTSGGGVGAVHLNVVNASELPVTHFEAVATTEYPRGIPWSASFYDPNVVIFLGPESTGRGKRAVDPPATGLPFTLRSSSPTTTACGGTNTGKGPLS